MFSGHVRASSRTHSPLAWIGVGVFVVSFIWLQFLPQGPSAPSTGHEPVRDDGLGIVVIDPGHGGQDSGMIHAGILEKDLALDVARRLDRILQSKGVGTLLTRAGDSYISLAGRAAAANREPSGLFVSIHFDEAQPTATGVETYYAGHRASSTPMIISWLPFLQPAPADEANVDSQSLAGLIQESLVARTHAINRGTRAEQFYVIANVRHPAVLVEGGFLTNKDEAAKLTNEGYREQLATAIADGVMKYRDAIQERRRNDSARLPRT